MNILYIHGLDSQPNQERMDVLRNMGHHIDGLHIEYRTHPNVYKTIYDFAKSMKAEFIIGSSLGGYLGYWLGQDLQIPQLIFNPAVAMRDIKEDAPYPISRTENIKTLSIIGAKDDVVDPKLSQKFFKNYDNCEVILCSWLEHQIDIQTFTNAMYWCKELRS